MLCSDGCLTGLNAPQSHSSSSLSPSQLSSSENKANAGNIWRPTLTEWNMPLERKPLQLVSLSFCTSCLKIQAESFISAPLQGHEMFASDMITSSDVLSRTLMRSLMGMIACQTHAAVVKTIGLALPGFPT